MAYRAPLTDHHADGTLCPADHKHTSSGKPLHTDCPGRAYSRAVCSCGWEKEEYGKGYVNDVPQTAPCQPLLGAKHPFRSLISHPVPLPEVLLPHYQTVGHLLQDLDPSLPIRLAINPDFPFTHYVGAEIVVRDGKAFIADDGQEGYLHPSASDALAWA
ncbi:hypothetical protein [Streptomyces griseus]|uniref:hypothetical protein n=1 Tax=Streptomyces griseus TaxID=1911 RepID=UPI0036BE6101